MVQLPLFQSEDGGLRPDLHRAHFHPVERFTGTLRAPAAGEIRPALKPSPPGGVRRIAHNTFFLGLSEFAARLSTCALLAFLGRRWAVSLYGQYSLSVDWVAIFAVMSELGLNALTVREVAHRRKKASFFLRHALVL